jgi:hypothetical protein
MACTAQGAPNHPSDYPDMETSPAVNALAGSPPAGSPLAGSPPAGNPPAALNNRLGNAGANFTDYICVVIGDIRNEWRLDHVEFLVGANGTYQSVFFPSNLNSIVFQKVLTKIEETLGKHWMRQYIFPIRLAKIEFWEVSSSRSYCDIYNAGV